MRYRSRFWPWISGIGVVVWLLLGALAKAEEPGQSGLGDVLLKRQLYDLESRIIRSEGRDGQLGDLKIRQDRRLAEQKLRTFKTRHLNNPSIPILKRRLDRSRKAGRLIDGR